MLDFEGRRCGAYRACFLLLCRTGPICLPGTSSGAGRPEPRPRRRCSGPRGPARWGWNSGRGTSSCSNTQHNRQFWYTKVLRHKSSDTQQFWYTTGLIHNRFDTQRSNTQRLRNIETSVGLLCSCVQLLGTEMLAKIVSDHDNHNNPRKCQRSDLFPPVLDTNFLVK